MTGPGLRTDILDIYLFRQTAADLDLLQLRRAQEPLAGTWQPVMGHVEEGETAEAAMWRELDEETGLRPGAEGFVCAWALQSVHPYYLPSRDAVMLGPRFAVEVRPDWTPTLDDEHDGHRWAPLAEIDALFMWPGQRLAIHELAQLTQQPGHEAWHALRLVPPATAG